MTLIRHAQPSDAAEIAAIYNDAVLNTTAVWNSQTTDAQSRKAWLEARAEQGYPVLVAEIDGQVAGYSSYGPWRAFDGFRATVENSVYIAEGYRGRGLARLLLTELIAHARANRIHVMITAIAADNDISLSLHRSLGFGNEHTMREVGQKFGRWLDLTMMELQLDVNPAP